MHGFSSFHEIIDFFKKVYEDVDGQKCRCDNEKCSDKLSQYVSIKKCHRRLSPKKVMGQYKTNGHHAKAENI